MRKGQLNSGRGKRWLNISARKEHLKEYLMSSREYKKYWGDKKATLFGGMGLFSKWLKVKGECK